MAEYIEREVAISRIKNSIDSWSADSNSNAPNMVSAYKDVLYRVERMPTADVVPRAVITEIFAEMEEFCFTNDCKRFAKLKKKYAEETENV